MFEKYGTSPEFTRDLLLQNATQDFIDRYESETDPTMKRWQESLMLKSAERNLREKMYIEKNGPFKEEFVRKACHHECDGNIKVFDDFGYFLYSCQCIESGFCLLSKENRAKYDREKWMKGAFIPGMSPCRLDDVTIQQCHPSIQNRLNKYLNSEMETKGLTLYGGVGVGKTSAFYLCLERLFQNSKKALLVTSGQFCTAFFNRDLKVIKLFNEVDYLLIDDLGREHPVEYTMAMFEEIICERYTAGKPTSFNMNLTKEQLNDRFPRIYDRQIESNITLMIPGPSLRGDE